MASHGIPPWLALESVRNKERVLEGAQRPDPCMVTESCMYMTSYATHWHKDIAQ